MRCCVDPSLRELIVEGELDMLFWGDVLSRASVRPVDVFDADYLDLTDEEIVAVGLVPGAKGRVLTLATALTAEQRHVVAAVGTVVDSDFDGVPRGLDAVLVATDGYSVENYAIRPATIERFLARHFGRIVGPVGSAGGRRRRANAVEGQEVIDRVLPASIAVTGVRKVLAERHPGTGLIAGWLRRFKVESDGRFTYNAAKLLRDSINAHGGGFSEVDERALEEEREAISVDGRKLVRGHDFCSLFLSLCRSRWGKSAGAGKLGTPEPEDFERWLVLCTAPEDIDGEPAALRVVAWFT